MPQLFNVHKSLKVPDSVLMGRVIDRNVLGIPFMRWPDGTPCVPVNMYFLDIEYGATGGSLKSYASLLTHIVRYCGNYSVPFEKLTDSDIWELSKQLQAEIRLGDPTRRERGVNRVRDILRRTISFLFWYQKSLLGLLSIPLVGEKNTGAQIVVVEKSNHHKQINNKYWHHRAMPNKESDAVKRPIPQSIIEDIELTIEKLSNLETQKEPTLRRYKNNLELFKAQLEYIRARRRFMLWIMKRTGLRPQEMVSISLNKNNNIMTTKSIIIPTMKHRLITPGNRKFPITLKDAGIFVRYLNSRQRYIDVCKKVSNDYEPPNVMFLSNDGGSIIKSSLEKDFKRLLEKAGYDDTEACLSMFRHRFITLEVIVHLKEFMGGAGKTRHLMTDIDYRSILRRVMAKTGHKSEDSLWHYIDIAWDEMNVWSNTDKALTRLHATGDLYDDLLNLRHELITEKPPTAKQMLDLVLDRLNNIINDSKILEEGV